MSLKLSQKLTLAFWLCAGLPLLVAGLVVLWLEPTLAPLVFGVGGAAGVATLLIALYLLRTAREAIAQPLHKAFQLLRRGDAPTPQASIEVLTHEVAKLLTELAATRATSLDLTLQLETPRLLQTIAERATHLLNVNIAIIYEAEPARRKLNLLALVSPHPWDANLQEMDFGEGATGRVAESGKALIVNDYPHWSDRSPRFTGSPTLNILCAPLHWQGQLIGVLNLEDDSGMRVFTEHDLAVAEQFANQVALVIGNARLYAAANRHAERLASLHHASRTLSHSLDLEAIYQATYEAVGRLMSNEAFVIALVDEDRHELEGAFMMDKGVRQPSLRGPLSAGLTGHMLKLGRPLLFRSAAEFPLEAAHYGRAESVQSVLAVPLQMGDRTFGALITQAYHRNAYTDEDLTLLVTLANHAAAAIQNARLFQATQRQLLQRSLLTEIALKAVEASNVDEVVTQATRVLQQHLPHEVIGVGLLDATGDSVHVHPSYSREATAQPVPPFPATAGITGLVIKSGQALRVDDVRLEPHYLAEVSGMLSSLTVPLKVAERIIGAINLESHQLAAFTEADEQLLTVVAGLLAPMIENARLRTHAEQHAQEMSVLSQAQSAAAASLDPTAVLNSLTRWMCEALGVTSVYIYELRGEQTVVVAEYFHLAANITERVSDLNYVYGPEQAVTALRALQAGRPLHTSPDDPEASEAERHHMQLYGARTVLTVPLVRQARALGYIELWESRREREFSAEEVRLAQTLAGNAAAALENARLYQAAHNQAERMRLVNEVGRNISSILNVETLLAQVGQSLELAFGYDQVRVGLVEGHEIVFHAQAGDQKHPYYPEARLSLNGPGLIAYVARTAHAWLAPQTETDPYFSPHAAFTLAKAEAALPLIAQGQTIGILDVRSTRANGLGPDDLATLEAISGQLAVAVENARLFAEVSRRTSEVSALLATTLTLGSAIDLEERLQAIAREAQRLVVADSCTIYRLDTDESLLRPVAIRDRFADQVATFVLPVGAGITGRVAQTGIGELINRADLDPKAVHIPDTPDFPENAIAVPLKIGERIIGAMFLQRGGLRGFEPHDLELTSSFAAQAAVAIENVELYHELKLRADSLQAAYNELAETDRLKDEMVQNISHELRTPLTFLKSYVDLLLSGDLGALNLEQERSLRVVSNKTETLARLVNDIITLQAVTPATIKRIPLDLVKLALTAADGAEAAIHQIGATLSVKVPDVPVMVEGDPLRLMQVFDNLLGNAVKFTDQGGEIGLYVHRGFDTVRVEVRDSGIGISAENLSRIFERFYQVDGTATRRRGGLGLGLTICKIIVDSHGGHIGVESQIGQGACFYFVLPLVEY